MRELQPLYAADFGAGSAGVRDCRPVLSEVFRTTGYAKKGFEPVILKEHERGIRAQFEWMNLATKDVPIDEVLDMVESSRIINPPRTAHIGGAWTNIARGGGAELVLNKVVAEHKLGYPLIFDTNQTPTQTQNGGDRLYWPGTLFDENGQARDLPLFTWNGQEYEERDRSHSLFTPFTMTKVNGNYLPLTQVHRADMKRSGLQFDFLSDTLIRNQKLAAQVIDNLLQRTMTEPDREQAGRLLKYVSDRVISNDGKVFDGGLKRSFSGNKFLIDGQELSVEETRDMLLIPYRVASDPELLYHPENLPRLTPLMSKEMIIMMMAVLDTDFYPGIGPLKPVDPHLHWGAFQMAGAPPMIDGYFSGCAAAVKELHATARVDLENIVPRVSYFLLPAAVFTLYPQAADQDMTAMDDLIARTHLKSDAVLGKPDKMVAAIGQAVQEWWIERGEQISNSLRSRFSIHDSSRTPILPDVPETVKPEGLDNLTFRQASILVGSLKDQAKKMNI